jgi:hypothetical protein
MQDDDADHEQAQRWLSALRDGTEAEKIAARRGLAHVFERRGMLAEAVDLLEANVRAGERSGVIFRWLAQLYREQGEDALSVAALADAAQSPSAPATPERSAPAGLPTGSTPTGTHRTLVLYLVALIGLGIAVGAALWLVAPLLGGP